MRRFLFTSILLAALLALSVGTVFAGSAMTLLEVRNDGAGPTFVFSVIGDFTRSELDNGFVHVENEDDLPLYCAQTSPTTVVCHTSKKAGGKNVVVGFGNARFWILVPEARHRQYCYSAWSWFDFTGFQWTNFGPICSDEEAQVGNTATYDIPEQGIYGAQVDFYDYNPAAGCGAPYDGPAYYNPLCPP